MFSNVWPFFCALLTCAYYKIYCSNSFLKKGSQTQRSSKNGKGSSVTFVVFQNKTIFHCLSNFFCHRSCTGLSILFKDMSGMTLAATGAQTLCTTVAEEQPLSAHPDTFMFQTHIQGQGNQMESHQQNRGSTSVAGMFPRQVSPHLSPAVVSSHSFTAMGCRRDSECPLDAAIKFHFAIMLAKVSLNPSQR